MQLKEYQQSALDAFDRYLEALEEGKRKCSQMAEAGETDPEYLDFARRAWNELKKRGHLPRIVGRSGALEIPEYVARSDERGQPIPHVCLKVPTGGGKTLLAASALERLRPRSGIVLWIVPSKAIFQQTWVSLATRLHPYRQALERGSAGRIKLFRKGDPISRLDVENHLCLIPVMLQAAGRKETGDFLKIFRDSGKYPDFFPAADDLSENQKMQAEFPDLHTHDLGDAALAGTIKRSLFNVLKVTRPIIVLDEAHNAYSETRRRRLCELNPRIMIELSATPKTGVSNILVNTPGEAMKRENMIKLPINIHSLENSDWKHTLSKAVEKLADLQHRADDLVQKTGKYIRPIMLIRVERVGREQRDGEHIHAEDVREELMKLGIPDSNVRLKSAYRDEIAHENLLSPYSSVRYIITKEALREGWDCSFAYVLTLLDTTKTDRAITQMAGRILRQPYAEPTGETALDECYIYCFDTSVGQAAERVKAGLEDEGMGDLGEYVQGDGEEAPRQLTFERKSDWRDTRIFLPQVLHRTSAQKTRALDYERDVLAYLDWAKLADTDLDTEALVRRKSGEIVIRVDPFEESGLPSHDKLDTDPELDINYFVRRISDALPVPWLAASLAKAAIRKLRKEGMTDKLLHACRADLAERMRQQCAARAEHEAHSIFCDKIRNGDIRFELVAGNNFELPMSMDKIVEVTPKTLQGNYGATIQKSLFDPQGIFEKEFNGLEKDFALHMDGHAAVAWWHRLAVKSNGYALQGWKQGKMYPDFVVCVSSGHGKTPKRQILVLETKGLHLSGNPDTQYKEHLLEKLEELAPKAEECGDIELRGKRQKHRMKLRILMENTWERDFEKIVQNPS
ncbi:MAG: DEAD/DEAH box helicase family protein [Gammaproteobacteria bacterium]|nr:DEAD/DEAH box helicase family protein [Gammaproteobacteria bacterium]MDE0301984.1 DEAD/DEAH box helicase family protein [Gammaproteobacteria bacterium]